MRRCLRVDMRLLQVAVSICAISLTACKKPQISPLTPIYSLQSSAEARVYRAFVKNHYEDNWKAFCPHAVLVTKPLSAETRDPSRLFSLQPDKPTNELIQQLNKTNDPQFVSLGNDTFFIPVDNEVINAMFRQPCSIEDAQQLRCGWLQFRQQYGAACGAWRFSHVVFNAQQDEALFRYDLGVYHWAEGGWAYMRRRDGQWRLISVGVEFVS